MASFQLNINGVDRTIDDIDPSTPLLWVLRDHLGLVGTKYGCGEGECMACTVLLDGDPLPSCLVTIDSLDGEAITTIEGLAGKDGSLHPLQKAWIKHDVAQCGYCQPGQIMTAVSLLKNNPNPSDAEIKDAMDGNLCRCGTYKRIHQAIKTAASKGGAA